MRKYRKLRLDKAALRAKFLGYGTVLFIGGTYMTIFMVSFIASGFNKNDKHTMSNF